MRPPTTGAPDVEAALAALAQAAAELGAAASVLRRAGLVDEAEILETNCMMAEDPVLAAGVRGLAARLAPAAALRAASEDHAQALAALSDPLLAARAADIRELGRRAARIADGVTRRPVLDGDTILVAGELGPAEVAELDLGEGRIVAIALAVGSATSHAAIIARSLGVPMAVSLGRDLIDVADGTLLLLDGDEGSGVRRAAPAGAGRGTAGSAGGRTPPPGARRSARTARRNCRRSPDRAALQCGLHRGGRGGAGGRRLRRGAPADGDRLPGGGRMAGRAGALRGARAAPRVARRADRDGADARLRCRQDAAVPRRRAPSGACS